MTTGAHRPFLWTYLTVVIAMVAAGCSGGPVQDPAAVAPAENLAAQSLALHTGSGRARNTVPWEDPAARAARAALKNASAPAGAHLTYNGGRVNGATQAYVVLWGSGSYESHVTSSAAPSMLSFYSQLLGNGSYATWLDSEYNTVSSSFGGTQTNQHISAGSGGSVITITPSVTARTVDDTAVQSELSAQIASGHLPAPSVDASGNPATYYAVFFPSGVTITQGGSSSCVAGGFCAYHGTVASSSAGVEYYYGVHPDMQAGSGCATGCGSASTAFGNYTSVASHELTEMITDAEVGLAVAASGPPLAWYDPTNGEIGDICNAQQGTYTGCDGQTYTIQLEFSNAQNNCIAFPAPSCSAPADFSITASPATLPITAGSGATSTISTAAIGSAGTVSLAVTGAPPGLTASLSPTTVVAGGSATLTIATTSAVAAGSYTLTVTGTEGASTHSATVAVTISAAATNDFVISASPAVLTIVQGGAGSSSISTSVLSGTAGTVTLAVSGVPAGVTASLAPTSVTAGGGATLSMSASTSAAQGTYSVVVTGTEGAATHSATIALTVAGSVGITNGGFESGLTGWTTAGSASIATSGCHGGSSCALLGSASPTNGDSSVAQTFTAPPDATGISFWYNVTCPDTVTYDWALARLRDNTSGTTATLLAKTCVASSGWTNISRSLTAGHSYTLTLVSHDDNYAGDPTRTLYDDVTITTGGGGGGGGGITNGGFESGSTGWTMAGTTSIATSGCHSGSSCAQAGTTFATNGNSSFAQTFTVPSGKTQLAFYYKVTCPDTVTYDWATATLKDNTIGTSKTLLPKTCTAAGAWTPISSSVTAGHSYTLTLTSHDDNYGADPTYTLFDDVTLN